MAVDKLHQALALFQRLGDRRGEARCYGNLAPVVAEFGNEDPLETHAWFIGIRGDNAVAVLVEGGGVGGRVAAPIAGAILAGLPGG